MAGMTGFTEFRYFLEALPYYLGAGLTIFFFVFLIITASMFASQNNTTSRPNEYLSDHLVFYPCGYTKKLKVMTLITCFGFLVLLPAAIAYGIGWVYLDDRAWIPGVITFGIGILILILIGRQPFSHKESCLVFDVQNITVKYRDGRKEDKVFHVAQYSNFCTQTRHAPSRLVFNGPEGEEILSLHFLRHNDAVTAGSMAAFIKENGRMPVIQKVASKQEAMQRIASDYIGSEKEQ